MEPFKNKFNEQAVNKIALALYKEDSSFKRTLFIKNATEKIFQLEMKDRVRQIAKSLHQTLPYTYSKNIQLILKTLAETEEVHEEKISGFLSWPYAQYVESYGLDNFKTSMRAMREITKRFTSEFTIRPYIDLYEEDVYKEIKKWLPNLNHHVRRLCSEGLRPNLPWGLKSQYVINNLDKNIEILESLKSDSSEYVRKSVANHLNDISRIDEELFIKVVKKWSKQDNSKEMKKLIRHACRTLLKNGHPEVLKIHGYFQKPHFKISNFRVSPKNIKEGNNLSLYLKVLSKDSLKHNVLIDYIIHFKKLNGYSKKVFRLKDTTIENDLEISKKIAFKKVTTRKHYKGKHYIEIQINGKTYTKEEFILK